MPYLLGLVHWGACRENKLGAMSKRKNAQIIGALYKKMRLEHLIKMDMALYKSYVLLLLLLLCHFGLSFIL